MLYFQDTFFCPRCQHEWIEDRQTTDPDSPVNNRECPECQYAPVPVEKSLDVTALKKAAQRFNEHQERGIHKQTQAMIEEIKRRAQVFTDDNVEDPTPSTYMVIESAMMIGATVALEYN
jgi:hypothetical protein